MLVSKIKKFSALTLLLLAFAYLLTGCTSTSDAQNASHNLSAAADQFEIQRQIIFYNGITGDYMLTIEGRCSIDASSNQLEVTCKVGPNEYTKDFLGLSDNVTYVAHQLKAVDVSVYHYRMTLKPETILPDIRVETGKQ